MKKISKLLIGTNNKGKYKEIKDLLPKYIKTYSTSEFKLKSPKEDGLTFTENSIIKSKYFSKKTRLICLADDSGLEIDLLNKSPGIYSARWGGKKGNFKKAINRVYNELFKKDKNWKNKKIRARFICALSIYHLDKKIASVLGKVEGYISSKPKGKNGFGYDPIFIPKYKRKTFGEMSSLQKYKIDHRFVAFKKIRKFL
ncbi:RdgB/HAM1 family non-canonical purine NTP pyrophosphatase [Candidatus Pelagibacter bacterium]|jgi:XTP/dITP diphosphohydrolase|nr:RdgB/HAM1 family non-canonical purine NTP pyrophosphatase [Candidatus Pelagibacter bacterium]